MKQLLSFLPGVLLLIAIPIAGWHLLKNEKGTEATFLQNVTNKINLRDGLVNHFTFDGPDVNILDTSSEIKDASGNGEHLSWGGQKTVISGKIGQAVLFNGVDTNAKLGSGTAHDNIFNAGGTIAAWIKPYGWGQSGEGNIVSKAFNTNGGSGYYFAIDSSSGNRLEFVRDFDSGSVGRWRSPSDSIQLDEWQHVVIVYDDSATTTDPLFFIDGALVSTSESATPAGNAVGDAARILSVGDYQAGGRAFDGIIDDVRIYNRGLSAAEVKALYNMGSSLKMNVTNKTTNRDGLVGHWTFDGPDLVQNVADVSGQGNHGNMVGFGATSTAVTPGKLGQGLKFRDSYVRAGSPTSLDDIELQAGGLSVSLWVNPSTIPSNSTLIEKCQPDGVGSWNFRIFDSTTLRFDKDYDGNDLDIFGDLLTPLSLGEWWHLTMTWDGSNNASNGVSFYVNSEKLTTSSPTNGSGSKLSDNTKIFSIAEGGCYAQFQGSLDDVRVYNRALSAAEVKALYNMGSSLKMNVTNKTTVRNSLVGHWTFDGPDLVQNVADVSGQGNHGRLQNFGATSTAVTAGKIGQGMKFDGSDDYVQTGVTDLFGTDFTISAWINIDDLSGDQRAIVAKYSGVSIEGIVFRVEQDGSLQLWIKSASFDKRTAANVVATGNWHNVVAVFTDLDNEGYLYVDGVLKPNSQQNDILPDVVFSSDSLLIGRRVESSPFDPFDGAIDDVRVYSKALTASEIKQLYNMGR